MRKNIFIAIFVAALVCLSQIVSAVPAKKGKVIRIQPDGSAITIMVHGDEWFHYVTDEGGNLLEEDASGFLVKSTLTIAQAEARMAAAWEAKKQAIAQRDEAVMMARALGAPKIPVILVQFSDKAFSISNPKTAFTNLLTQQGYSANGGTGCVSDYYRDQSRGKYTPQFVVMDVVTLSSRMSTYGSTDTNAARALYEACQRLDSSVDFSQFDNDGDGKIDMALMYYAGYNEAEGGSSSTIWPHQYYVPYVVTNAQAFDGVKLDRYFCTSELKGNTGTRMCGIGTTCHEFAHSLGLPDFYDANYNDYGDGEAGATYDYDVMCSGPYNNNGCTPPWMNAEELMMLGWMDSITDITASGKVTVPSISAATPVAYKSSTAETGEYFLYECRPGTGWDAPLEPGLLIYHVDKSPAHKVTWKTQYGSTTKTAQELWANWEQYNAINNNGSHPCFYIVPSGAPTSLNYTGSNFTFPGRAGVGAYTPIDWAGNDTGFTLSGINYNSTTQTVSFNMVNSNTIAIEGYVYDAQGNAIVGATVSLYNSETSATSGSTLVPAEGSAAMTGVTDKIKRASKEDMMRVKPLNKMMGSALYSVNTDSEGHYSIDLLTGGTFNVEASMDGFVSKTVTLEINRAVSQNFTLLQVGQDADLYTWSDDGQPGYAGGSAVSSWSLMCADYFPSSMLKDFVGKQIKEMAFVIGGDSETSVKAAGTFHLILDFGNERVIKAPLSTVYESSWNSFDVSGLDLTIPEGKDIYAGFAMKDFSCQYPLIVDDPVNSTLVGYMADYDLNAVAWEPWQYVFLVVLTVGDPEIPDTGYNYIDNPKPRYKVGDELILTLIQTAGDRRPNAAGIKWFFDDEPVSGSVILKSAGHHTVTARFTTAAGDTKAIDLDLLVE